jgi:uncharacterized membrane protein HdeD (DUF308 family)|tara:strand:- start:1068 stop:1238 length:171 start_codon:yes stop_codon:yes gene_type:complete
MNKFFKKVGISDTFAAILMIGVGVTILIAINLGVDLVEYLIAIYLVIVGVVKLVSR